MSKRRILYFIQLPPPYHGVSSVNQSVFNSKIINSNLDRDLLKISFSANHGSLNKMTFKKFFLFLFLSFDLIKKMTINNYDLVYFSIAPSGIGFLRDSFFVLIMKIFRPKIILHIHGVGISKNLKGKPNLKFIYEFIFKNTIIIHLSEGLLRSEISNNFKKINFEGYYVNNGVNIRKEITKKDEAKNILFLSNLFPSKGIFEALEVFNLIHKKHKDIVLNIAGAETSKQVTDRLSSFIEENNLKDRVILHGFLEGRDKEELLSRSDLLLYPTKDDAFPLVLLEAMNNGMPIVATDIGAIGEIVKDGETGFVCTNNVNDIERKMLKLIENAHLFRELSLNSRKRFEEKFTFEIFEKNLATIMNNQLKD